VPENSDSAGTAFFFPMSGPDADGDGTFDACDNCALPNQNQFDCDGDGIGDVCAIAFEQEPDCNGNGMSDSCDVALVDCNFNGVPDECEGVPGGDCNANGTLDVCETAQLGDCNVNGVPDPCELAAGTQLDCDNDGIIDSCAAGAQATTYQLDDGEYEYGVSVNSPLHFVWLNAFTVTEGSELGVQVFGLVGWVVEGAVVDAAVWRDPTRDGDPEDALLVAVVRDIPITPPGGETLISIPPTWLGDPGDIFFVGLAHEAVADEYPAVLDENGPDVGWWTVTDDLGDLASVYEPTLIQHTGCWIVRLDTTGVPDRNGNGVPDTCETFADLDGDGVVTGSDLGLLLASWGPCRACTADLSGDGIVDGVDLGLLLAEWTG
jgi:hypothetical protein